jgi:hypothetical protein
MEITHTCRDGLGPVASNGFADSGDLPCFEDALEVSPEAVTRLRPMLGCEGRVAGRLAVLALALLLPATGFGRARFLVLISTCLRVGQRRSEVMHRQCGRGTS